MAMKQSNTKPSAAERARIRRLRAKYRKRMLIVGIIFFILGIVAGALVYRWYTGRHSETWACDQPQAVTPVPTEVNPFGTDLDEDDDVVNVYHNWDEA